MGQSILNGLVSAALIAPPAVAFSMLFAILRFPNFAIGGYIAVGAFAAYAANLWLGLPLWLAALVGMAVAAVITWLSDVIVFRPMRGSSAVTLLVVSIALTLIIENVIRFIFGADVRGFDLPLTRPIKIAGLRITIEQIYIMGITLGVAGGTHLLLAFTWLYCGALFGLTGVLAGLDLVIEPLVGWNLTIPIFAAAILGGIGSPYGAMLGAILVGLAEEFTTLILPSTYKVGVGFAIIAILLLLRPHGLLGTPEIKK